MRPILTVDPSNPTWATDPTGQRYVDVSKVIVDPGRGRKEFKDMVQLKESIEHLGLNNPITIDSSLRLVAGERRYRAFMLTGQRYIPCRFGDDDELWRKEWELEENIGRQNLNDLEQCELLRQIDEIKRARYGSRPAGTASTLNPEGWTVAKTAELAGQSVGVVSEKIKLAKTLKERPDLVAKVAHLPLSMKLREVKKIMDTETHLERLEAGIVQLSSEVRLASCLDPAVGIPSLTAPVDLWLTDPPFGNSEITIQNESNGSRKAMTFTGILKETDNLDAEKLRAFMLELIPAMSGKSKEGSRLLMFFAFEHYQFLVETLQANDWLVDPSPIIWDKGRGVSAGTGYNFPTSYEPILLAHYKAKTYRFNDASRNLLAIAPIHATKRFHAFQKPAELLGRLVKICSSPGQLVADPCAGSGAVVKTARELGRSAIGWEIDKDNWSACQLNLATGIIDPGQSPVSKSKAGESLVLEGGGR